MEIHSMQDEILKQACDQIRVSLDKILIEGLKLKGHSFNNDSELINFIENNCKKNILLNGDEIYLVNDVPFLMFRISNQVIKETASDNVFKMTIDYGSYSFI